MKTHFRKPYRFVLQQAAAAAAADAADVRFVRRGRALGKTRIFARYARGHCDYEPKRTRRREGRQEILTILLLLLLNNRSTDRPGTTDVSIVIELANNELNLIGF